MRRWSGRRRFSIVAPLHVRFCLIEETVAMDQPKDTARTCGTPAAYQPEEVRLIDITQRPRPTQLKTAKRSILDQLDLWNLRSLPISGQPAKVVVWEILSFLLPCLKWLAEYDWKTQLPKDVGAGLAVTFLKVPQGLSYAGIAGLPAICGSYTNFAGVFMYVAFGTSRYVQVGAVAIVSLLVFEAIQDATAGDTARVAALKVAASAAKSALAKNTTNKALSAASTLATNVYNNASVELVHKQVEVGSLLAVIAGLFAVGIGGLRISSIMELMSSTVISGFSTAAAITIGLSQAKSFFGMSKDISNKADVPSVISSLIQWAGTVNSRTLWLGLIWLSILLFFKYVGGAKKLPFLSRNPLWFFKFLGPIIVCIVAILATKYGKLYLSPGCTYYDPVAGVSNILVPGLVNQPSVWNISSKSKTAINSLGDLVTYKPDSDNPGCVPMPKSVATDTAHLVSYPWPQDRGVSIVGTFGKPPTFRRPNFSLADKSLLTHAIIICVIASLETVSIGKALAAKRGQTGLDVNREFFALGLA